MISTFSGSLKNEFGHRIGCGNKVIFRLAFVQKSTCVAYFKVEEKVATKAGITWKRAMDEVRTERLMARHGIDTLLVLIRDWPSSEKYENEPVLLASLEYLVCIIRFKIITILFYLFVKMDLNVLQL